MVLLLLLMNSTRCTHAHKADRWQCTSRGDRNWCHLEEVIEEIRVLFQVEADGLVVHLHAADLDSHILEEHMLPGSRAVVHHHHGSIVILIILHIQEDQLLPVVELLADTDEAGDVDASAEQLQVLHQLLHLVPADRLTHQNC